MLEVKDCIIEVTTCHYCDAVCECVVTEAPFSGENHICERCSWYLCGIFVERRKIKEFEESNKRVAAV